MSSPLIGNTLKPHRGMVVYPDGRKIYYKDGRKHRLIGPAYDDSSGFTSWWYKGVRHNSKDVALRNTVSGSSLLTYYLYGHVTLDEQQFHNKSWRRKAILDYIHDYT
jgi:hypothetical protein